MPKKVPENDNLIFCAYAYEDNMSGGVNITNTSRAFHIYLKNAVVALASAKLSNRNSDVALVSNIDIPSPYREILNKNSILIFREEFDSFHFDATYKWGLAFYKHCALKKMLARGYKKYLLIDTDTYTQNSLDDLWLETDDNIMLYDTSPRLSDDKFNNEVKSFNNSNRWITQYGGEFIAANSELLSVYVAECENIYNRMMEINYRTNFGDEFITSIAADRLRTNVKNSGAYMYRYWTARFYLTSTCHIFDPISILHVPAEKERGMLALFKYFVKHNKFPKAKRVYRVLHLPGVSIMHVISSAVYYYRRKASKLIKQAD